MKKHSAVCLFASVLLLAGSMLLVSCKKASSDIKNDGISPSSGSVSEIKIGGIFPLSGSVAVYGIECKNGVELAIKQINAAGGIDGKKLVLIAEDDEGNPEKTVNAYQKLTTKDGVKIIIGSLTSGCTAAITNRAQVQQVLLVAPAATAENITSAGNFVFRACFIDPFQGTVGGKFAAETLNARNAAVIYDVGNDYSVGLYENFKIAFERAGGKVTAESYSTGEKDFNAQITKIKQLNPDVVYLPEYYSDVALIAKQLRAQGINSPIVGADGWDGLTENAGDEVLNGFYSNHYAADSTDPRVVKFVSEFKDQYNSGPVSFAALGYDSLYMIKDAIVAAKSTDSVAVRNAFEKTSGAYVTGNLRFDAKRNPIKSAVMVEIVKQNGQLVLVYKSTVAP
jgi:branched-chain amino acid transport system substrate-binding protein